MEHIFRVFDYNFYNTHDSSRDNDDEDNTYKDTNVFMIQIYKHCFQRISMAVVLS